jgi:hypothetical protein
MKMINVIVYLAKLYGQSKENMLFSLSTLHIMYFFSFVQVLPMCAILNIKKRF